MSKIIIPLLLGISLHAQVIQRGPTQAFIGSGAPGSITRSRFGDIYINYTTGESYICTSNSTYCNGVSIGHWQLGPAGPVGPQGPDGATGATGAAGSNGAPGTKLYTGNGAPSSIVGIDGDSYLDRDNGNWYDKASGAWAVSGVLIAAGVNSDGTPSFVMPTQTAPSVPTVDGVSVCPDDSTKKQLYFDTADSKLKSVDCSSVVKTYALFTDITFANISGSEKTGNGSKAVTATAAGTSGVCAEWDASGNLVSAASGLACGSGGGGSTSGLYSGTVNFTSIADGSCQNQTISATGATTGMSLAFAVPSSIDAGLSIIAFVSAADTITFRACNFSGAAVDPASATFAARNVDSLGYFTGSATINPSSLADGACATAGTITVTGASTGDNVAAGWPSTLDAGVIGIMYVSAADTVTVRICNWSGASVDVASSTFKAGITR